MLYLKAINPEDWEEEYKANSLIPADENGFENRDAGVSAQEFREKVIPRRMAQAKGEQLPEGFVPDTLFYLWDDDHIVGKFKIRHRLNDNLRKRGGHIGYCILKPYRGQHFATKGLALALEKARDLIEEDYVLMSALKENTPSLKAQLTNGAKIIAEGDDFYMTRTELNKSGMPLLFSIDTKDYDPAGKAFIRNSGRCIAIRDHKVALIYSPKHDYYKFPGGGIEENETGEEAMIRETREEAGLVVLPDSVRPFGYVHRIQKSFGFDDGADMFIQDNYYYLCDVSDEVVPQALEEKEADEGFVLKWVYPEVAIAANLRSDHGSDNPNMIIRDARVLALLIAQGYLD